MQLRSNVPLKCRVHRCRLRCHRVVDHSRAECNQLVDKLCDRQHRTKVPCGKQNDGCLKCIQEDKELERKARRDLKLEEDRRCREAEYTRKLQEIQDEIEHQRRIIKYTADEELRKQTLEQHRSELAALKEAEVKLKERNELRAQQAAQAAQKAQARASQRAKEAASSTPTHEPTGSDDAKADWEFQKQYENAQSKPMDGLMEMIGLEEVKQAFLSLKSKVDTALRQNVSMASERFSCSMLGNPGTGSCSISLSWSMYRKIGLTLLQGKPP